MRIEAHESIEVLQELSYHYQAEIEMMKDICSRFDRQHQLLNKNSDLDELRKIYEISKESEYNSQKTLELLREAKARTEELITYCQKLLQINID